MDSTIEKFMLEDFCLARLIFDLSMFEPRKKTVKFFTDRREENTALINLFVWGVYGKQALTSPSYRELMILVAINLFRAFIAHARMVRANTTNE